MYTSDSTEMRFHAGANLLRWVLLFVIPLLLLLYCATSILKYNQIINLLLLDNSYHIELLYTIWSLVTVRNQLLTQVVNL